jgi:hypothetical protein
MQRLAAMSLPEIAWRARSRFRDSLEHCAYLLRIHPIRSPRLLSGARAPLSGGPKTVADQLPWNASMSAVVLQPWREAVVARADALMQHRIKLFDAEDLSLGRQINWNYEYKARKKAPLGFAPVIDYRDYSATGDAKWVWELSRHHHLVALGRAYRLTGNNEYAREAATQLEAWIQQCPFGTGMNWRSPLEFAIRLINWVWTLELIRPSGALSPELSERIAKVAYYHLWDISRKYSRFSSANNHLIGEAAGVFVGSSYFSEFRDASKWRDHSREILLREIMEQTFEDGGSRELAVGYHIFVLQFFLLAGLCARNAGSDFPAAYWDRLEKMFEFIGALSEGGDSIPMFGDCDDGYVLDLGGERGDVRTQLAAAAVLFDRSDFKAWSGGFSEAAFWLLGKDGRKRFNQVAEPPHDMKIESRAFPDSGYYLLQSGHHGQPDRISVVFDCGDLGYKSIAAHGHADALSFTVRAFGTALLVDPGTYDYFTYPDWRDYFRSTQSHSTVVIDGENQSEMLGLFLWGRKARAKCLGWEVTDDGAIVTGEHDGYRCLPDPVTHRRTIRLNTPQREILVTDEIAALGRHSVTLHFHFAEHCTVRPLDDHRFDIQCGVGSACLELDSRLTVTAKSGGKDPITGWVSRGYHRKVPATTVRGHCTTDGDATIKTRLAL